MAEKQKVRAFLSPDENLAVGVIGGCLETGLQMPLLTWKFCTQEGRPLPTKFSGFYRGVVAQAGSVAPITALQTMLNGGLEVAVTGGVRNCTDQEKLGCSMMAGALSATVYGPVDLVTIWQQKLSKGIPATMGHIYSNFGLAGVYRATVMTALREAIYTCGYLGITPVAAGQLKENKVFESELACTLGGSIFAGSLAAILSHPVDTIKTVLQGDLAKERYTNSASVVKDLMADKGVTAFFRGGFPRLIRCCGAFFTVAMLRDAAITYKTNQEEETHK